MPWDDGIGWNPGDPLYPLDPGNPFMPSPLPGDVGSGAGGVEGAGGSNPGGVGDIPGNDWTSALSKLFGGSTDVLKSLGLLGKDGNFDIGALLAVLAAAGGGVNTFNATKDAVAGLKQGAADANKAATDTIGGAQANYAPYISAGQDAIGKLQGMIGTNNLADKYAAHGNGASGPFRGAMTLAQLVKGMP